MFDKLEVRAILQYGVTARSDLHIGSHGSITPAAVDNPVIKTLDGRPFIPGSSLKGVLRTEMERLVRGSGKFACTPENVCGKKKREGEMVSTPCIVCQLFGGMGIASSIKIHDAYTGNAKVLIRDGVGIDRKTRKAKSGTKYDLEVVAKGGRFEGEIVIENPNMGEYENAKLGALLSLVDFFNTTCGRLGHATSRGFGKVELSVDSIRLITARDYLEGNYKGTEFKSRQEYEEHKKKWVEAWREYLESQPDFHVEGGGA